MNDKIKDIDDTWKGVLFDKFEKEDIHPSVGIWNNIENELFAGKKRSTILIRITFFLSLFISFIFMFKIFLQPNFTKINLQASNNPIPINPKRFDLKSKNKITNTKGKQQKNTVTVQTQSNDKFNLKKQVISAIQPAMVSRTILDVSSTSNETKFSLKETRKELDLNENNVIPEIISNKSELDSNEFFSGNSLEMNILPVQLLLTKEKQLVLSNMNWNNTKIGFVPFSVQFGLILGRNYRTVSGNFNPDNINTNELGSKRINFVRNGIQIGINYRKSSHYELNCGFQLLGSNFQSRWVNKNLQLDPNTSDLRFQTVEGEVSTADPGLINSITNGSSGVYKLRLNYSKTSYAIPIGFTYYVADKKWTSYMRGGVNFEFIGRRNLSIDVEESNLIRNIELDILNYRRRFHLIGSIALGCEFRATSLLSIYLEPMYQLPLSRFSSTTSYLVRSSSFGIVSGIKINI